MSLHPEDPTSPPEDTCRVARAAFPKGTLCLDFADALGPIYRDSQFAGLFPQLGQPAERRICEMLRSQKLPVDQPVTA